ncbi:hypothetical protein D3C77_513940 [compost metagenome]
MVYLSIEIWNNHKANHVQTYLELGAPVRNMKVMQGEQPSTEPFCIVGIEPFKMLEDSLENKYSKKAINNGILILEQGNCGLIV